MMQNPAILEITPERAAELLKKNLGNRRVRPNWVHYLAEQLRRGSWQITTDAIGLKEDGSLGNGQHRLLAIVEAALPAKVLYIEGLTDEGFRVLDSGIKRSTADALGISHAMASDATLIGHIIGKAVNNRISQDDIADIVAWWNPISTVLAEAFSGLNTGLSNSSVRCGVGLQWQIQHAEGRKYVLEQYVALMNDNTTAMSRAVAMLWKRLSRTRPGAGARTERVAGMVSVFRCFDPRRSEIEPLIKVPSMALEDVRRKLLAVEESFANEVNATTAKVLKTTVPALTVSNKPLPQRLPQRSPMSSQRGRTGGAAHP